VHVKTLQLVNIYIRVHNKRPAGRIRIKPRCGRAAQNL